MTVAEMKELTLRQLQEDVDEVAEYAALLDAYLEYGYVELMYHRKRGKSDAIVPLSESNLLPEKYHLALVDYATYRILANGNAQKQQRGMTFLQRFLEAKNTIPSEKEEETLAALGGTWKFSGLHD